MQIRLVSVGILFAFAEVAAAAPNCASAPSSHAGERACWIKAAEKSSELVRTAQETHRKRIKSWSEDAVFVERTLVLFNESTRRFSRYRQSQCEYEASTASGGNGAGDMRLSCQVTLDQAYLRTLRDQSNWFQSR